MIRLPGGYAVRVLCFGCGCYDGVWWGAGGGGGGTGLRESGQMPVTAMAVFPSRLKSMACGRGGFSSIVKKTR